MTQSFSERADRALARWLAAVQRRAGWVVAAAVILTGAALAAAGSGLAIYTDTDGMIAPDAPFMSDYRTYKRQFPVLTDDVTVLVEAPTPDQARDATSTLATALAAEPEQFPYVFAPQADPFFARNGLLYLDRDGLLDLLDSIAEAQPLLQPLRNDMTARGLFGVLDLATAEARDGARDPAQLDRLFARVATVIEDRLAGGGAQFSWQAIMRGDEGDASDRRGLIIVQPPPPSFDDLSPGKRSLEAIRAVAAESGLTPEAGVQVSLTGGLALGHDELAAVRAGASVAGLVSLALVTVILGLGLRSARMVAASVITLVMGLIWTAGFAAVAVGHLNMISVAFAVLFVSLGIDFSIHICLAGREQQQRAARDAVGAAVRLVAGSLLLCAFSTAIGFYAFLPTDFSGVAELGLIAGTGMGISLAANLTLLPALLALRLFRPAATAPSVTKPTSARRRAMLTWPERHRRVVLVGAAVAALGALTLTPQARFDFNPINLHDPAAESAQALRRLMAEGSRGMWAAASAAPDAATAETTARALEALETVDRATTLADLVPDDQIDKLGVIGDIAFIAEPDAFAGAGRDPADAEATLSAAARLRDSLDSLSESRPALAGATALSRMLGQLAATPDKLAAVEDGLLASLPGRLAALDQSLQASRFGIDDLPEALRDRLQGEDSAWRIEILPAEDIALDNDALRRFVADIRTVDPRATGRPVIVLEAGNVVIGAFVQAMIAATVIIALVLWAVTRRLRDVAVIMAPLALTALLTAATAVALGLSFNFANVIVLPLILGIGVDSAIHLHHRRKVQPEGGLLESATARAVLVSGLTTIAGFGSLMLSPHLGMASLGLLLVIGVGYTLVSTLLLMPALTASRALTA